MNYETKIKSIVNIAYIVIVTLLFVLITKYGLVIISPFIIAFIVSYFIKSISKWISRKTKISYKLLAFLLVLLFYSTVGLAITLLGVKAITVLIDGVGKLPEIYTASIEPILRISLENIKQFIYGIYPNSIDILNNIALQSTQSVGETIRFISLQGVNILYSYAAGIPTLLINTMLCIISTFFIAMDYDIITSFVMRQFSERGRQLLIEIKEYIIGTLFVVIRSYALIMIITFIELAIGLSIIGISHAIRIALGISIFDILPVLGTGGIMIPWIIITAISGNPLQTLGLLIVYVTITIIRNILEPKIVGAQIGLHPIATLIAMFVGANIFGIIGLIGFPIVLSLVCYLNNKGAVKIFKVRDQFFLLFSIFILYM